MTIREARAICNCSRRFLTGKKVFCRESCPAFNLCDARIFSCQSLYVSAQKLVDDRPKKEQDMLTEKK